VAGTSPRRCTALDFLATRSAWSANDLAKAAF
jgi:hypothetical protein